MPVYVCIIYVFFRFYHGKKKEPLPGNDRRKLIK